MAQEMTSPQSDNYTLAYKILHILGLNYTFAEQEPLTKPTEISLVTNW